MTSRPRLRSRPARLGLARLGLARLSVAVVPGVLLVASLAGCVSMQSGGAVQSYDVTQGPGGQSQPFMQTIAQPPGNNWQPDQIVQGFLTACASVGDRLKLAREYLAPDYNPKWNPKWSATVFSSGPFPRAAVTEGKGPRATAVVTIEGAIQANLSGVGGYAVPSSASSSPQLQFRLRMVDGQWRISYAPSALLLTSDMFDNDYQQRNLYFFDAASSTYLVPDPVYVPLQATTEDLMDTLVDDLIHGLPNDWLHNSTTTALPAGTARLGDVTLVGGTAAVNLKGNFSKTTEREKAQISSQLWWTLAGSGQVGQAVQSVELLLNGRPWIPQNAQQNPVQHLTQFRPPVASNGFFYYLDSAGNVWQQDVTHGKPPTMVTRIGSGYRLIAVSPAPDGQDPYLAALRLDGTLFTGPLGGKLVKREDWQGAGYTSMSWDPSGNLWATTGNQIVMLSGGANPAKPASLPIPVNVANSNGSAVQGTFTALRIAPDGVRVAIIVGNSVLNFGAISFAYPSSARAAGEPIIKIALSPFYVSAPGTTLFSAVTWYGPNNVITLGDQVLTEYPVSGGSSTSIPAPSGAESISALLGYSLIAGLNTGVIADDATLTGAWGTLTPSALSSAKPKKHFIPFPVYPG